MACNYPIPAYRIAYKRGPHAGKSAGVVFAVTKGMDVIGEFKVPCGQCMGCRLERARQWAVRCVHEASLYEKNEYITLTYNDEHLPDCNDLKYDDFQKFMKRLRKRFKSGRENPIRFFMCGEYGDSIGRPHYHACLFNVGFDDRIFFKYSPSGKKIYTSEILDSLWRDRAGNSIGFATTGDVTFNSAGYVARYIMKKKLGAGSEEDYQEIDRETGEIIEKEKEFTHMSLRPGIGSGWYDKYKSDIFPHDICVVNGVAMKPPQYYYKKLEKENGFLYDEIQFRRHGRAVEKSPDNTEERLLTKEKVLVSKIALLKRELK